MATDYAIVGPPTIDLRTFQAVLTAAHSPMAGSAPAVYAAILSHGVDPAVVLAIAQHESGFGKAGIAVGRNNPFGSRYYPSTAAFGAINRGGWAAFPNYAAAASYTAALLASHSGNKYGGTARTFPVWYAPSSDGNNPKRYGLAVVNAINRWRGQAIVAGATGSSSHKATGKAAKGATAAVGRLTAPQGGVGGVAIVTLALAGLLLLLLIVKR